ncbi:hypothetical protein X777_10975 [Ooceraea biroi]|uniref:Uncharacterized protein n=1 Tax=Ooceraea biroi TaxID=2015173 RepID=A0A026W6I2_OOCBI|nr:hypothetical protein X777_10975 [Ooceraea biroi]
MCWVSVRGRRNREFRRFFPVVPVHVVRSLRRRRVDRAHQERGREVVGRQEIRRVRHRTTSSCRSAGVLEDINAPYCEVISETN